MTERELDEPQQVSHALAGRRGQSLPRRRLFAIVLAILALALPAGFWPCFAQEPCPGQRYPLSYAQGGSAPYIGLEADGRSGKFLLDYGATASSVSNAVFQAPGASIRIERFSLPSFSGGNFALRRYDLTWQPPGGQLGIVGTDFLSLLSAHFEFAAAVPSVTLSSRPCDGAVLSAQGFAAVPQAGFFSADPAQVNKSRSNVPVVFLRIGQVRAWAQLDTGYDDRSFQFSIDINGALFKRLQDGGVPLVQAGSIAVSTCDGTEMRDVYTVGGGNAALETGAGAEIERLGSFYLITKPKNSCGGISAASEPAAQLGASFLKLFADAVFDPKSGQVWLKSRHAGKG
jgi:hypothetical protein